MAPLERLLNRYGWLGAFLAALTPIPDDLIYIPLGIAKYSPWKFATATFSGKLILNEAIVWGAVILGGILYLFLKIDWGKVIGKWFPWTTVENDESKERLNERNDEDDQHQHNNDNTI